MNITLESVVFDDKGLIPAIVQDVDTKSVLMLAYMNEEALKRTIQTQETWFYSRSRQALWHKGETSGNIQKVSSIAYDCDKDTLLVMVKPMGVACHTGSNTCFSSDAPIGNVIDRLYDVVVNRKEQPQASSYTNYLFNEGIDKILKKVGEEASEVIIASKNSDQSLLVGEISDLAYHLVVLMVQKGVTPDDIRRELLERTQG